MNMEMKMISMEKIKPASATPAHLKIYKICLLDQFIPSIYIPVVLYFSGSGGGGGEESNISGRIQLLKDSLSQTLVTFYPFAGVIRDSVSADCNDEGLPFSVAEVKGRINDFLENLNLQLINEFHPDEYKPGELIGPGENLMLIRLNYFECGGIALSIVFAHYVADITSIATFLRSWAANARGRGGAVPPLNCIAQSSFPQKASLTMNPLSTFMKFMRAGKFVTRRYVFDATAISILKAELSGSRVQAVTAVIWKCFMAAVAEKKKYSAPPGILMTHVVNLRRRAAPPFPEDSFGNFLWVAWSSWAHHDDPELKELVREVNKGISRVDAELVRRLGGGDDDLHQFLEELIAQEAVELPPPPPPPQEAVELLSFTSWANSGLYDVDLGWGGGRPLWVSSVVAHHSESETMLINNLVILMDRREGDGIEAWVKIDKKYVEGFERNEELNKYARINPSVF